ncbi:MAG TPA: SDR family oxidoreductase [Vicinamibacteria bacterium]|jgi:NAD(P)-dependent dehydrogenase (short-subunit alcohol dehydrogenase family)|nr:SDR family oxidoreductase [Vicinamibacteria bacterium]
MFELTGKVAVVTGAGSGIGAAIATLFARQGARVVVLDVDEAAVRATAERIGSAAEPRRCDVSDAAEVAATFAGIGALDILVNNAGVPHVGTVESTSEEDLDRLYRINVKGVFLCARAAVPIMLRRGAGVILNMASIAALVGIEDRFAYSMTKGAVLSITRSIAVDYMKKIRCNCICPARVHTPFVDAYLAKSYAGREKEMFQQLSAYQPLGRMGTPEEVAALALYLCSDEASFITGQAYPIDGGVLVT